MCMSVHAANAAQGNLRFCETEEIADEFHKGCQGSSSLMNICNQW